MILNVLNRYPHVLELLLEKSTHLLVKRSEFSGRTRKYFKFPNNAFFFTFLPSLLWAGQVNVLTFFCANSEVLLSILCSLHLIFLFFDWLPKLVLMMKVFHHLCLSVYLHLKEVFQTGYHYLITQIRWLDYHFSHSYLPIIKV